MKEFENTEVVWEPKKNSRLRLKQFKARIYQKYNVQFDDYWSLHKWSVENFRLFWAEIWDIAEIIHSKPYYEVFPLDAGVADAGKWFQGARLNYAENLLKYRDDHVALICAGEERTTRKITYANLYEESCKYGAALRKLGLKTGDNVACYMSNREEAVFAMIGATSVGAVWSGALPLFGAKAVVARFRETQPKFLFTIDRFINDGKEKNLLGNVKEIADELKCLEKIVIVPSRSDSVNNDDISDIKNSCYLPNFLAFGCLPNGSVPELEFEQLPFNHAIHISYTSGTSGPPKAVVHGIGVGWASWYISVFRLQLGRTTLLFEGVPFFLTQTFLWNLIDEHSVSSLFITPSVLYDLEKRGYIPNEKHHLTSLKLISSGGSVVKPQNYDFVYKNVKRDIIFCPTYGCTELMGGCLSFEQTLPAHKGEITAPVLAMGVECLNDQGKPVMGAVGEIVVTTPNPQLPLFLWNDTDGSLYKEYYFSKFKNCFVVGDLCAINPTTRGTVIIARSDDVLKPKGARFGSSEIYNVVNPFPEIHDSICVSQYNGKGDERAVLFLKMREGFLFNEDLVRAVRRAIEEELTKQHLPEIILETNDIPHNLNSKKMESIVKRMINKKSYNSENIINPESLQYFENVPELQGYCSNTSEG